MLAARALAASPGAADEAKNGLAEKIAGFFDFIIGQVPSWIAGFVVFILTIFVAKLAKNAVESRISDQIDEEHQEVLVLSGRITFFGIMALGVTVALKIAGIDLTTILAAVAFGIGFALRDLISNFIAGVMILVSRQFKIGDFLKIGSTMGCVMEIQTRATILKSIDGTKVIVPNSKIFSNIVISTTTNPLRRIEIPVYVSYDTDIKFAMKVAMQVLKTYPKIQKKPAPSVLMKDLGDSSIDLAARFWVGSRDGWLKIKSDVMHKMFEALNEAGIKVPYNMVHVENSQDTAEEDLKAMEKTKKKLSELEMENAVQQKNGSPPIETGVVAPGNQSLPALVAPMPLATTQVPTQTEGELQDLMEIDGQG